jgi:predicted NodU family carbamoyl transferase
MSTILGLAVNFHDSNLALVKEGTLCEVVEVERLSRIKKMRATELVPYLVPVQKSAFPGADSCGIEDDSG